MMDLYEWEGGSFFSQTLWILNIGFCNIFWTLFCILWFNVSVTCITWKWANLAASWHCKEVWISKFLYYCFCKSVWRISCCILNFMWLIDIINCNLYHRLIFLVLLMGIFELMFQKFVKLQPVLRTRPLLESICCKSINQCHHLGIMEI